MRSHKFSSNSCDLGTVVLEMQSWKYSLRNAVPDSVSVFHCFQFFLVKIARFFVAVAVSRIEIGTRRFRTRVRVHDSTRCASIIVLKLIRNSIKGKKKII